MLSLRRIFEVLFALTAVVRVSESAQFYALSVLANRASSEEFSVSDETACWSACSGNISAVSYSELLQKCITSKCANIRLVPNAMWRSLVCVQPVQVNCDFPGPILEWMLTDACGFGNTGSMNRGWSMDPAVDAKPSQWAAMYKASLNSTLFGNVVQYPNVKNYQVITTPLSYRLDFSSSFTFFGYFIVSNATSTFPIIEFGSLDASGSYQDGPQFWINNGSLQYRLPSGSGLLCAKSCFTTFIKTIHANRWTHAALVYNSLSSRITMYLNGTSLWNSLNLNFSGYFSGSLVLSGSRPQGGGGQLAGSTYCLKVFEAAMSASQLLAISQSCAVGQLTL